MTIDDSTRSFLLALAAEEAEYQRRALACRMQAAGVVRYLTRGLDGVWGVSEDVTRLVRVGETDGTGRHSESVASIRHNG